VDTATTAAAESFRLAVTRLVGRTAHWTPPRWQVATAAGVARADAVHGLVQAVADLAADAEGQPRRPVPRLDNDLAIPDQLRVVAADLIAAAAPAGVLRAATERVVTLSRALS
jgi:hypothetical protein